MNQKEDESFEDFVERLEYNVQRSGHPDLDPDILKTILLKVIKDEHLDMLNLLGKGNISKESYQDILTLCQRSSRGLSRSGSQHKDTFSRVQKSANGGVTRAKIGNLFEDFKTELLNTLTTQIDTLQEKQKQVESKKALSIFCSKCRQKHPLRKCPLNSVELCGLCEQGHPTNLCPTIPKLKSTMKGSEEEVEQAYFINQ